MRKYLVIFKSLLTIFVLVTVLNVGNSLVKPKIAKADPNTCSRGQKYQVSKSGNVITVSGKAYIDEDGAGTVTSGTNQSGTSYGHGLAASTNYIALNQGWANANHIGLGDVASASFKGKTAYLIYGDNHCSKSAKDSTAPYLEISSGLARSLGIDPKNGSNSAVTISFYPGTASQINKSSQQSVINQVGQKVSGGIPGAIGSYMAGPPTLITAQNNQNVQAETPANIDLGFKNVPLSTATPQCQMYSANDDNSISAQMKCNSLISNVWKIFLGFVDAIALALFMVVAFATILHINYDTYGIKKALPALILGLVMAHFSLFICRMIVDVAQISAATFYNAAAHGYAGCAGMQNSADAIACNISQTIFGGALKSAASSPGGTAVATVTEIAFPFLTAGFFFIMFWIVLALILIPTFLILILSFELYIRFYILMFFAMISPIAWLAISWTPLQGAFKKWWGEFARWAFVAPLILFYIWLSILFYAKTSASEATFGTYLLSLVMLWLAIQAPGALGGAIGGKVSGIASGLASKATKAGGTAVWNKGNDRIDEFAGRPLKGGGNRGDRWGLASPRSIVKGFNQSNEKKTKEFREKSEGNVASFKDSGYINAGLEGMRAASVNRDPSGNGMMAKISSKIMGEKGADKIAMRNIGRSSAEAKRMRDGSDRWGNDLSSIRTVAEHGTPEDKVAAGMAAAKHMPSQGEYDALTRSMMDSGTITPEQEEVMHRERLANNYIGEGSRSTEEKGQIMNSVSSEAEMNKAGTIQAAADMTTQMDPNQMRELISEMRIRQTAVANDNSLSSDAAGEDAGLTDSIRHLTNAVNSNPTGNATVLKFDPRIELKGSKYNNSANKMTEGQRQIKETLNADHATLTNMQAAGVNGRVRTLGHVIEQDGA